MYGDPPTAERLATLIAAAHPKRGRLGKNQFHDAVCLFRTSQYSQQHAGTVLLHLQRRSECVQGAFGQRTIDDVAKNLRIQIVEAGLKHGDGLFSYRHGGLRLANR